jgi:prepilin signal peptidase PulO-like enzyme (type II secretory pathway)
MFVFGLIIGSFLNVVAYRIPRQESIVFPGSHCPHCGKALAAVELIPVLSWVFLRGRCRNCHTGISMVYPLIELITATLFVLTLHQSTEWSTRVAWCVFWSLLVVFVGTDLRYKRVPDILSKPGAVLMLMLSILCGIQPWGQALIGMLVCYAVLMGIHILSGGNMGRGDAKLYLSIGAMLGPWHGLESLVFASFAGTTVGLALRVTRYLGRREHMPFVPYIVMGVIVTVFFGEAINHWYFHLFV